MTPDEYVRTVVPAAMAFLPAKMDTREARAMLVAIGLQESRLTYRAQIGGPARGLHQFETGGVSGVLKHAAVRALASQVAAQLGYPATVDGLHPQFETDDILDCCFARLLLYVDPRPMPGPAMYEMSWSVYIFGWRPGKPHRQTWDAFYDQAWAAV
jgi:hypothetical protein